MPNGITTDQLNIVITVDSKGAITGIEDVKKKLVELGTIAESPKIDKLSAVASAFSRLGIASEAFEKVDFSKIGAGIVNVFESLEVINSAKMPENVAAAAHAFGTLEGPVASFLDRSRGLYAAAEGMSKLHDAIEKFTSNPPDISEIREMAEPMRELGITLSGIDKTGNNVNQLKNGLEGMSDALKNFSISSKDIERLEDPFNTMSAVLERFSEGALKNSSAFYRLAMGLAAVNKVGFDANLAHNIDQASKAIANFADGVNLIPQKSVEDLTKVGAAIGKLSSVLRSLDKMGSEPLKLGASINTVVKAVSKFSTSMKLVGIGMKPLAKTTDSIKRVISAVRSINNIGKEPEKLSANVMAIANAIEELSNQLKKIPESAIERMERIGNAISKLRGVGVALKGLTSYMNATKKASRHSSEFLKNLKKFAGVLFPFKAAAKSVKHFGDAFKKLGHTIGRLVLYRFLRSMIRAIVTQVKLGIDALYNWSDVVGYRFKGAMDGLATSFQYLRNSVAAMLSPLVEYLQPVIDSLIDRFVEFLNVVNQFIATMTGKDTYVRAIKGAAKYAEETEYAAAAQEKLNRTILGFDELNKLNDANDRGHGSPSNNAGGGEFEEVPITESFGKINWNDLGKKLSDGIATALGGINWKSIQEKTKGVVQKVIGFINSFFGNEEMWTAVGLTVSGGINTLTTAITTFADEGEWKAIGANIQAAFMAAVGDINWENLGKSLVATFKIFANLFIGFASAMTPEDWKDLGTKIGKAVNAAIQDIPWGQLLEDMLSFAAGLTDALIAAVKAIDWIKIGQEIKAWWEDKSPDLKQKIVLDAAKAIAGITAFSLLARGLRGLGGVTKAAKTLTVGLGPLGVLGAIALLIASGPKLKEWCDELSENLEQAFWTPEQSEAYKKQQSEMDKMRKHGKEMLDELLSKGNITQRQYNMWLSEMGDRLAESPEELQTVINSIERIYSGFENGLPVKLNTFGKFLGDGTTAMERSGKKIGDSSTGMAQRFEAAGILINGIWSKLTIGTEKNAGIIGSALQTSASSITKYAEKIGVDIPGSIARGAKNNRKAITEVNGEIIADFTGMRLPDMSVKGSNIPKSLAQGIKNNKNAITKVNGEIVADFTGLKTPDKTAEGSKFARNIAKGVSAGKPTVKNAIDTLARTLDIKLPNMSSAGNGVSTSLAKGITAKKSDVQSAVTGISNTIKLLDKDNDNSPLYPWTWGYDFAASFASGLSSTSAIKSVTTAANTIATRAKERLAFSKPEKGPLSDADTYGPDFMKLYAQGIEDNKYLVTNAVSGLASDVNNAMALENTYTLHNEPTGLDSLAQAITNSDTPINVYIGSDKLDSVIARSNSRLNYRSGGRF